MKKDKEARNLAGQNFRIQKDLVNAQIADLNEQKAAREKEKKLADKQSAEQARRLRLRGVALRSGLAGTSLEAAKEGGDFFRGTQGEANVGRRKLLSTYAEAA